MNVLPIYRSTIFGELTKEKLCKLSLMMTEEHFGPFQTIIEQDQPLCACYILASGQVCSQLAVCDCYCAYCYYREQMLVQLSIVYLT